VENESFFKKYGKLIMVIFSSALMITFVMNSFSKGGGSDPTTIIKGTLNGHKISQADLYRPTQDLEILDRLVAQAKSPFNELGMDMYVLRSTLDHNQRYLHMYLLLEEARKYGLVISPDEVDQVLRDLGISDEDYRSFLEANRLSHALVRRAIADVLAIRRLDAFAADTLAISVPQLEHLAVDTTAELQVRYVQLTTASAAKLDWVPAPAAQEQQFADYKGVLPATAADSATPPLIAGHHYPFGYKYPDRIKLEVLTFDRALVRQSLKASTDDVIAARKEYKAHPEKYQSKPAATLPDTKAGPATHPTTEPAPTTRPFDEVRADILKEILDGKTDQKMHQLTEAANNALKATWDTFQSQMDTKGFYNVPPEKWPSYEAVAADLEKQYGIRPKYEAYGKEWLTRQDLTTKLVPGIGSAALVTQGRATMRFVDLAMNVHELQASQQGLVASLHLQVGVDGPVVTSITEGTPGNMYIYRVSAASPTHEPATLAEVKDAVIADLRRVRVQEENLKLAQELVATAARKGLEKAAAPQQLTTHLTGEFTRLKPGVLNPYTGASGEPQPMAVEPLGIVPEFTRTAFDLMVRALAPATPATGTAPATAPAAKPARETAAVALDSRLEVFAIELVHAQPTTEARFEQERANLRDTARASEVSLFLRKWYTFEETSRRMNFVPKEPFKESAAPGNNKPAEVPDVPVI